MKVVYWLLYLILTTLLFLLEEDSVPFTIRVLGRNGPKVQKMAPTMEAEIGKKPHLRCSSLLNDPEKKI